MSRVDVRIHVCGFAVLLNRFQSQHSSERSDLLERFSVQSHAVACEIFLIDNLLVRIRFIVEIIWRTGLAPREFEYPFPR